MAKSPDKPSFATKEGEMFNPSEVAIALTTFYPNWHPGDIKDTNDTIKVRGDLAKEFIENARARGYSIIVMDSGSSDEFLGQLPADITVVKFDKKNFGLQKREAIDQAAKLPKVKIIFRIEPEKIDMIDHLPTLCELILKNEADIVIGNRKEEEFKATYPDYAYESETRFNRICQRVLHMVGLLGKEEYLDLYSGAIALRNKQNVLDVFNDRYKYDGPRKGVTKEYVNFDGWFNAQVGAVILALKRDLRVKGVTIPFKYDPRQKANEENPEKKEEFIEKRKIQRLGGIGALIQLVRELSENEKIKRKSSLMQDRKY